jgi:hypothetical protein
MRVFVNAGTGTPYRIALAPEREPKTKRGYALSG